MSDMIQENIQIMYKYDRNKSRNGPDKCQKYLKYVRYGQKLIKECSNMRQIMSEYDKIMSKNETITSK